MNVRNLARVIGAALQIQGVERHAARLARAGWLPRAGCPVDADDAAALLLAVLGAPDPEGAVVVVDNAALLPLQSVAVSDGLPGPDETWRPAAERASRVAPPSLLEAVGEAIECMAHMASTRVRTLVVQERGRAGVVSILFAALGPPASWQLVYALAPHEPPAALQRHAEMSGEALRSIALALRDEPQRTVEAPEMQSMAIH